MSGYPGQTLALVFDLLLNSLTNDKMRSKRLNEASDETMVNLIVGYKESMKAVNSSSLVVSWVHRSKISPLYLHHGFGLISPDLAFWSMVSSTR